MNEEQQKALRAAVPEAEVGKLPRVTCPDCRESKSKVCSKHAKSKCQGCGNYITGAHIHLDYFGHAETTDRLLDVDPEWSWEPIGWGPDGMPLIGKQGGNLVMWGRLTVAGVTRLGVGTCVAGKDDAHKELIGDLIRNASMRFGVALDLWRKSEKAETELEHADEPVAPPQAPSPARTDQAQGITKPDPNLVRNDAATGDNLAAAAIIKNLTPDKLAICKEWWTNNGFPFMSSGAPNPLRLGADDLAAALDFLHDLDTTPEQPAGASDADRGGEETEAVRALANNGLLHPDEEQPLATPSETEAALARSRAHLNKPALGAKR